MLALSHPCECVSTKITSYHRRVYISKPAYSIQSFILFNHLFINLIKSTLDIIMLTCERFMSTCKIYMLTEICCMLTYTSCMSINIMHYAWIWGTIEQYMCISKIDIAKKFIDMEDKTLSQTKLLSEKIWVFSHVPSALSKFSQ